MTLVTDRSVAVLNDTFAGPKGTERLADATKKLWTLEGVAVVTGPAVERAVFQRNRGQAMSFGDLQFLVPSSGNSSFQFRSPSGLVTITNFTTHWSHQQGGASEEAFNFALGTGWRYFRQQGLTLTQHNNFQEAQFSCNGWLYHVMVIVGGSWLNNRFAFTRWREDGIQGIAGADGTDGTDGTDGVDGTSVDHTTLTAGDSSPGTANTYTLWGDAGETVNLGTFDVPIPTPADSARPLEDLVAEGSAATSTGNETVTLNDGKKWTELDAEYEKVFISVKETTWRGTVVGGYYNLADLIRDGGASIWCNTSGSSTYEINIDNISATGTTLLVQNNTPGAHALFKMWGVRKQKELHVITPGDYVVDETGAADGDSAQFVDDGAGGLKIAKGAAPAGNYLIQRGTLAATANILTINFPQPFATPPTVTPSLLLNSSSTGVATVDNWSGGTTSCRVILKGDWRSNDFVHWVATGEPV